MLIDFHTHTYPDKIAEETVELMAKQSGTPLYSNGSVSGLVKSMKEMGVDKSVTLPVATKPSQVQSINNFALKNEHEELITFGAMHPEYEDVYAELKRIKEAGIKGIKLHPDYQSFYPHEKRLYPIYEACSELGLIILFHCGDDIGVPAPGHALPRLFAKMLSDFPQLTAVFAHMGGWEMWDQASKFLAAKDLYFDTAMVFDYIPDSVFMNLIDKHGADKVLFATDSPWASAEYYKRRIDSLPLSAADKDKIFYQNALSLLNI